ncbi:unnamed protein product [Effrenium voratum]|uniref:Uncharacterized protein n=1 Tax=Effrenium voratum TaxID=2562239 RepID=A0AA36HL12_9DINO|nr:unnamed protein product [Effrenium voratum]
MENMLGKEFNVRSIGKDGSIYLPSPDGSEGGVWTFPPGAAKLKVSLTLPIDEFLHLAEKKEKACSSAKEKKDYGDSSHGVMSDNSDSALSGYDRPVGAPDVDKTLTRNRMGYFICFDVSDDSMASLKEAMAVHKMLSESLEKAQTWSRHALSPHIWLVGCKSDKANSDEDVRKNRTHADAYAEQHDLICRVTSARQHKGVNEVFVEMLQAISSRTNLWTLDGDINEDEEDEDASGCFSQ